LRSNNAASDFALLEINGNLHFRPEIAFAGWNRNTTIPTQVITGIHHPQGDAKKNSNDNEELITTNPNMWIVQRWDLGLVERGSSGSPIFDGNNRIFGQLNGGDLNIGCNPTTGESLIDNNRYGRFDLSWTGGGTNATRLSNWLGGVNPPTTTNTLRASNITPFVANNGFEFVCTTNRLFTLNAPVPGTTVTWSVSNPGLFATSGGASTSGTGTNATLRAFSVGASGSAVLTFTMTGQGCGQPINVTRQIWVGRPGLPLTFPSQYSTTNLGLGQSSTVYLSTAPGAQNFIANFSASGAVSLTTGSPSTQATYVGNTVGSGSWTAITSNVCGTTGSIGYFNVTSGGGDGPLRVVNVPNPTSHSFICSLPEGFLEDLSTKSQIKVLDSHGNEIISDEFIGLQKEINAETWSNGIYFTKVNTSNGVLWGKVLIIK
jgi:hypothetical protein